MPTAPLVWALSSGLFSLPLVTLVLSERAAKLLQRLSRLGGAPPHVIGLVLILVAASVLYTATPYFDISGV